MTNHEDSSSREQAIRRASWLVAALVSVAFGCSFGFDYGVDNQVVYLLGALDIVQPELFENDWLVQHTTHYHPVYHYICAALLTVDPSGWAVAGAVPVVTTVASLFVYWVLRSLMPRGSLAALLALQVMLTVTATRSLATTYIVDHIFQPSTLGACGTIVAIALFVRGRYLASGVALAVAGACHANFLVLGGLTFGLAHLYLGARGLGRRGLLQLLLPSLVLAAMSPMIIDTALSPVAEQARNIYFNVRAPHHFSPTKWSRNFGTLAGWHLLGFGLGLPLLRQARASGRRFAAITGGLVSVVWLGTLFTTAYPMDAVKSMFPWRLAPLVLLMLQIMICAALVTLAVQPRFRRKYGGAHWALIVGGLGWFAVDKGTTPNHSLWGLMVQLTLFAVVTWAVGWLLMATRPLRWPKAIRKRMPASVPQVAAAVVSVGVLTWCAMLWRDNVPRMAESRWERSVLVKGFSKLDDDIHQWMKTQTPVDAIFLTPPWLEHMRFRGQRAIIVDWKSNPVVPEEVLEWHQRLVDVTGHKNLRGRGALKGYRSLNRKKLAALQKKYRIDYVVVSKADARKLGGLEQVWTNPRYAVFKTK